MDSATNRAGEERLIQRWLPTTEDPREYELPTGLCKACGLKGQHSSPARCIEALRSLLAMQERPRGAAPA